MTLASNLIEFVCSLCLARGITTYLCPECGACPKHEKHSDTCPHARGGN